MKNKMSSLKRKLNRKKTNKTKKKAEKELAAKVALFGHLADKCLVCEKPFNKLNKEHVITWSVVVKQKEQLVRLYCPTCWDKAKGIVENFMKEKE